MTDAQARLRRTEHLVNFIRAPKNPHGSLTAVSLFSGAGLSDLGYMQAGFRFLAHAELDKRRAKLGQANDPDATWVTGDLSDPDIQSKVVEAFEAHMAAGGRPLDLLVATPPCQGMSSTNPSRGKRSQGTVEVHEAKNRLVLEVIPIALKLRPRVLVLENVRQIRTLHVKEGEHNVSLIDLLRDRLPEYVLHQTTVNVADYGVPQHRKRAMIVAVRHDQTWLSSASGSAHLPWPTPSYAADHIAFPRWLTVQEWFQAMAYEPLDASSPERARGTHPLHFVPYYGRERYDLVRYIPPHNGGRAYATTQCPHCPRADVPEGLARCLSCGGVMHNRPCTVDKKSGEMRLINQFASSYRRMPSGQPAPTVTTASNHIGSDYKIHPWENRLLSILECAHLQTVPDFYDWTPALNPDAGKALFNVMRDVIGEAFPPYFTYLHGLFLTKLLGAADAGEHPAASSRLPVTASAVFAQAT